MFTDKVSEADVLGFYLGITSIPCNIISPFRHDSKPSLSFYSPDGKKVNFIDFGNFSDRGSLMTFFMRLWNLDYNSTVDKIVKEVVLKNKVEYKEKTTKIQEVKVHGKIELQCKIRKWRDYDIEYWESYGVPLKWLEWAEVYPISHKFIIKDGRLMVFGADKYAYTFVHHKDNRIQLKIYQPYNKLFKWCTNLDKSVWSLWDKIPPTGNNLIISSSFKDCLNIMANLNIPAICLQGEGYIPKPHVMQQLKDRYKNIIVFYDNDYEKPKNAGHTDAVALCEAYNLKMIEIPAEYKAKDPSDLFKKYGKEKYLKILRSLLKDKLIKG